MQANKMNILLKELEVWAESNKSKEEATDKAILLANKSVQNIKSIDIGSCESLVNINKNVNYRVKAKVLYEFNMS